MESGLLLCDIGNSTLKVGLAQSGKLSETYSFPTRHDVTADSLGLSLLAALKHSGWSGEDFAACVAVSVVPALNSVFAKAMAKYLDCETLFAPDNLPVPLANHYKQSAEVGADRLVGAYAATMAASDAASVIVVDFGTAVTFDCVSANAYLGGLIFPGPTVAVAALANNTAKLPHVNLEAAESAPLPGLDTATSIRHGLVFGYACLTKGLCGLLRRQLQEPVKVIATGGFAADISRHAPIFDLILPNLLLDGLLSLYTQSCVAYRQPYK